MRSLLRVDGAAVRANVARLRAAHGGDVWAVVKADGYGHGAADVGRAALEAGAIGLGVATLRRGARRCAPRCRRRGSWCCRRSRPGEEPGAAGLDVVCSTPGAVERAGGRARRPHPPEGRHGHGPVGPRAGRGDRGRRRGRATGWAGSARTWPRPRSATRPSPTSRSPASARSPTGSRPVRGTSPTPAAPCTWRAPRFDGAGAGSRCTASRRATRTRRPTASTPVLTWTSEVRMVSALAPGEASGYGRRIRAERPLRVAHVPVGLRRRLPAAVGRHARRSWSAACRARSAPWRWTSWR